MKTRWRALAASLLAGLLLTGCAITRNATPIKGAGIELLCIRKNPDVFMGEFLTTLESQIRGKGLKTQIYEGAKPGTCRHRLEYTANWRWDFAMYLYFAELKVYEGDLLVGDAVYDARAGGLNFDKFGPTAEKMQGLVNDLFPGR